MKAVNNAIIIIVKWITLELKTRETLKEQFGNSSQTPRATRLFVLVHTMTLHRLGKISRPYSFTNKKKD